MGFSASKLKFTRIDIRAWLAFLLGAIGFVLALSYIEVRREPALSLDLYLWILAGKVTLIALFVGLIYGIGGNLPFSTGAPDEPRPEPGLSQWIGLLAVGVIILYLRNAHSIMVPVLFTEDGTWSAELINRGFFNMLFNAKADYFVFGNILFLGLAQLTNGVFFGHNLTYLPHFVSLFSTLFYAAIAVVPVVLLREVLRIEARLLLWLLVLLVPLGDSSYEVLGRLSNIGFAFIFLASCLLIWRHYSLHEGSRKQIIATDAMLFLCANTNPLCYPLILFAFAAEAWQHRQKSNIPTGIAWIRGYFSNFRIQSAFVLLSILFITGVWILLRDKVGSGSAHEGVFDKNSLIEAVCARVLLCPFVFPFYSHLSKIFGVGMSLVFFVGFFILVKRSKREKNLFIFSGALLAYATILTVWSRPVLTQLLHNFQSTFPDRYYFGLTLLVYLLVAAPLSACFGSANGSWRRAIGNLLAGILVGLYAGSASYLFEFTAPRFFWLPTAGFHDEVKKTYQKGVGKPGSSETMYEVALPPAPWSARFPADYVLATVLGVRSLPPTLGTPAQIVEITRRYNGKVVYQKPAGRGREDGLFYVMGGVRSWITDIKWLKQNNLSSADVIEISSEEFSVISDSGQIVK